MRTEKQYDKFESLTNMEYQIQIKEFWLSYAAAAFSNKENTPRFWTEKIGDDLGFCKGTFLNTSRVAALQLQVPLSDTQFLTARLCGPIN